MTFAELCGQFGISRKTGYKRVQRYEAYGWEGLGDRSRVRHRHPNRTSRAVAERLIAFKHARPKWGPKKIVERLRQVEPDESWPAPSTAGEILDRAGLVKRRKRRRHATPWSEPFAAAEEPNDVWSIDFKGWFRTGDGVRIDPLTVQDAASRYLLVCNGLLQPTGLEVQAGPESWSVPSESMDCPRRIRSEFNGPPFASIGAGEDLSSPSWRYGGSRERDRA